jgi:hypothetical protein
MQAWEEYLKKEFEVRLKVDWKACLECFNSSGACGIDKVNQTTCYCPNQSSGSKTCTPAPAPAIPARGMYLNFSSNQFMMNSSHLLMLHTP